MFPLLSVAVLVPVPAQYETYSEVAWCGHHVHDPPKLKLLDQLFSSLVGPVV
jgi:hypothetical protein